MSIELYDFSNTSFEVKASLYRNDSDSDCKGVCLVFPGAEYSHMGPCLYYPSKLLLDQGYDILNFEYNFRQNGSRKERFPKDEEEAYKEFFDFLMTKINDLKLPATKIVLAKSLGTRIIAAGNTDIFQKVFWFTPALKDSFVREKISKQGEKSSIFIGDEDFFFDEKVIKGFERSLVKVHVVKNGDNGLEISNNLIQTIDEMKNVMNAFQKFLA
tara:strand:+ start:873 stop:1514 length:642 start_codon:yes stop_codon:yes gene_type:complete